MKSFFNVLLIVAVLFATKGAYAQESSAADELAKKLQNPVASLISLPIQFNYDAGEPRLVKQPEMNFIDDKEGKPVGIHQHIGKRPIIASGNSDGDYQMLEWTTSASDYPRLGLLLHHTDSAREFAYDRESHVGRLNKGLDDAEKKGWLVIDMKEDWSRIYPSK